MSLATIETEARRTTDKVYPFSTGDLDAAITWWYLFCWNKLDKVAPYKTRSTVSQALDITNQSYTLSVTPLRILYIHPSSTYLNSRQYIAAVEDQTFYQNTDQSNVKFAQRGDTTLLVSPILSVAETVTIHYIRTPPTLSSSQSSLAFSDQTLAAGAAGKLLTDFGYPEAKEWLFLNGRLEGGIAISRLQNDLDIFRGIGNNSSLQIRNVDGPWV